MFETLTHAQIADTLTIGIIGSVIATLLIMSAAIFFKPFNNIIKQAREWWVLKRQNSPLNIEVTLSGNIKPINFQDFDKSVKSMLLKLDDTRYLRSDGGIIKAKRNFKNFSAEIDFIPTPSYSSDEISYLSIIIKSKDVGFRSLKDSLFDIHTYLFRDISLEITKLLTFSPLINKEGMKIIFNQKPAMLDMIKDIDIKYLTSKNNDLEIDIFPDNIKIIGKIGKDSIDNIEYLIRKNMVT